MSEADRRHFLPGLRIDELLTELQSRIGEAMSERESLHALLDAVVSIGSNLELEAVLLRIIEAAKTVADCRYGALGLIGENGQLTEFIPVGMTEDEVAGIAEWPHGRGLLGLLIKHPQTLRLPEISAHPESYGFPPGHPPMHRFLGVPLRVRDEVFGNLYLTEKSQQREFDEQDEIIVKALATAAGIAIENARLYQVTKAREVWLDAISEVTRILLSGADRQQALTIVAARAREMADGGVSLIAFVDGDRLRVEVADGDPELVGFEVALAESVAGRAVASAEPVLINDPRSTGLPTPLVSRLPGPAILLPIAGARPGLLVVSRRRAGVPFADATLRILESFSQQVGVVMELADARHEAERYGLVEDRERIARDLHDLVVQRLYGIGMHLQGAANLITNPLVEQRVQSAVDGLDDTIRQIRSTIFGLQLPGSPRGRQGLRAQITQIADQSSELLGFAPSVRMAGLLDTDVADAVAADLAAVLEECLSNVVRHAQAKQVDVTVELSPEGALEARVSDNGVGPGSGERRSGLLNLEERAIRHGGTFRVEPGADGGTTAVWFVPLAVG
ncbi:GAF domain-containing sensor histidine kinase [Microlunatus sp. GCM10028923]|uniref:sensor histidine kinase n=1 Tax=Microlunatus sp. GCM10028923 TaxID=3273400 RepID=UPI003618F8EF